MFFDTRKNILIGQGETTLATARYLEKKGYPFKIFSLQENRLPSYRSSYINMLEPYTLAWVSPGIQLDDPVMTDFDPMRTCLDIEYFLAHSKQRIIAVTGTNGKSTVVRYLQALLTKMGYRAACYGNYQVGVLSALETDLDWVILELSSFQLARMRPIWTFDVGVILNIQDDHLAWHGSHMAYREAKLKLCLMCACLQEKDFQVKAKSLLLTGRYTEQEAQNLAAALVVLEYLGLDAPEIELPILPFRQNIYRWQNKWVINDSKSTTIASTLSALMTARKRFPNINILLILAGIAKSSNCQALVEALDERTDIVVIGEDFQTLNPYLKGRYSCIEDLMSCMMEHEGVIVFSPAGASYDQYGTFTERGEAFNRCICIGEG